MKKLAVFFPGIGYTVDKPLMHYSRRLAAEAGFQCLSVMLILNPNISSRMIRIFAVVAILVFPQSNCDLVYARKPRYSSKTLNSISPEQTGSTASVFPKLSILHSHFRHIRHTIWFP